MIIDKIIANIETDCKKKLVFAPSQSKPKFAARACHFPRTTVSDKNKKIKNPFPSVKI